MPVTSPGRIASGNVTLDAGGNGQAQIGPINASEVWTPQVVSVKTNQAPGDITLEAQCRIFAGPDTSDLYFVDGTLSGSTGDSTDRVAYQEISVGAFIFAVWTGGDPGAEGIVNVYGTKQVG